jgi:hypothetical protein
LHRAIFAFGNGIVATATVTQWTSSGLNAVWPLAGAHTAGPVAVLVLGAEKTANGSSTSRHGNISTSISRK